MKPIRSMVITQKHEWSFQYLKETVRIDTVYNKQFLNDWILPLKFLSVILKFNGQKALDETIRAPSLRSANRSKWWKMKWSTTNKYSTTHKTNATFQLMINIGTKCKVIDEDNVGSVDFLAVLFIEKISFEYLVFSVSLSPPAHQTSEVEIHTLRNNQVNSIERNYKNEKGGSHLSITIGPFCFFYTPCHFTRRWGRYL